MPLGQPVPELLSKVFNITRAITSPSVHPKVIVGIQAVKVTCTGAEVPEFPEHVTIHLNQVTEETDAVYVAEVAPVIFEYVPV